MSVTLPPGLTNKLAAVNVLLQTISESPVNSLDTSLSVDVAAAVQAIDEVDRSFQAKGWHWNREDALTLAPDITTGYISLPDNYLWVANAYWTDSGSPVRVSERARQLYDRDNHTLVFTDQVTADLVLKLDFEDMPEYARQYVTIAAAVLFQARLQGSPIVDRVTQDDAKAKLALVEQREDEAEEQNSVYGNAGVVRNLSSRGVRRRY